MTKKLELIVDKKLKFIESENANIEFKGTFIQHTENDTVSVIQLFYTHRIPQNFNNSLIEILHDNFSKYIMENNHTIELQKNIEYKQWPERLSLKIKIPKDKYNIIIN